MPVKLSARQRTYIRKKTTQGHVDPSEMVGELNIIPFLDIVVNLIMFLLITTEAVLLISQIESDLPKIARGHSTGADVATPLNLNVTVTYKDTTNTPGSRVQVTASYVYDPFTIIPGLGVTLSSTSQGVITF